MVQNSSEMVKYFRNSTFFTPKKYIFLNPDDIEAFWESSHPVFNQFRMIPYPTVLHQVESLSEDLYNTIPAQPPPSVPTQKTKAQLKQGTSSQGN